jgi:hypothetical protein
LLYAVLIMRAPKLTVSSMAIGVAGLALSAGVFFWTCPKNSGCHSSSRAYHRDAPPPRMRAHPPVDGKTPCPAMMRAHHGEGFENPHASE